MLIYRFKVTFEDHDEFIREIELRADQTFEDFHHAIMGNLALDPGMLASFFLCDHRFRKKQEIPLATTEFGEPGQEGESLPLMHEASLMDYIDDPHQRLMYVYDKLNQWTFYVELVKIAPAIPGLVYPRFTRSVGPVPRELTLTPKQLPGVENQMDFDYDEMSSSPPLSGEDLDGLDQLDIEDIPADEGGGNDLEEDK